ncbi:MAG: formate C-acetyltransferase [Firmicutes bacterium HGW-Firmicutes-14]|nr:MAG: formate C-acetyltransferase [Firmicutes bacterium HGW-Firmicutes-14]
MDPWQGFNGGNWQNVVDVRDFIQKNYKPYTGSSGFLTGPSSKTLALWEKVLGLLKSERARGGILDADVSVVSSILSHSPGYIDKDLEIIAGLQTDQPLKRALMPYGGIRMVRNAHEAYGFKTDPGVTAIFTEFRKTHNQGVFDAYTREMRRARKAGIITGLPDTYGRGRIIGDYRRVALYGADFLIKARQTDKFNVEYDVMDEDLIRIREEISEQLNALEALKGMAKSYGFDVSRPARSAVEAVQWTYFAYLGAIKEQNGAAMSLGRVSAFLDIYIERDLANGIITEEEAQELIDQLVLKLRLVRFLRTPEYNELFSGDPAWVTESIGGMSIDGRTLVTKNSYRFLHTLDNLGPAPEPNMTVLWSQQLPEHFKKYCAGLSIRTSSIQYENDDIMRPLWGDDYAIACCVSAMRLGKQMQYFGARANLAKALLYAINGGWDEILNLQVGPKFAPITSEYLDYDEVMERFDNILDWLARLYINTLNIIHYMHDKYYYERLQFALHDTEIHRTMACGIAGLSVVADSLSAIKYARVKPVRNQEGYAVDYEVSGDFPQMGNNDPKVDQIAVDLVVMFERKLRKQRTYRGSEPTLSILTITSNVVYGKKTGNTPDGRKTGEPFAPGANPMHGRDRKGALASLSSVAKLPYDYSRDGISYTFSIIPRALGKQLPEQISNLAGLLGGYFAKNGHHMNANVFDKEILMDAIEHPEKYPQLTIRVSGYAVNFIRLSREQQQDVINRTLHGVIT